jgi:hypothetical protein
MLINFSWSDCPLFTHANSRFLCLLKSTSCCFYQSTYFLWSQSYNEYRIYQRSCVSMGERENSKLSMEIETVFSFSHFQSFHSFLCHSLILELCIFFFAVSRNGKYHETNFDISDSFIVARYTIKQYRYKWNCRYIHSSMKTKCCPPNLITLTNVDLREQELLKQSDVIEAYKHTYLSRRGKQIEVCSLQNLGKDSWKKFICWNWTRKKKKDC